MYSEASGLSMSAMARATSRRFRSPVTIPRRHRLSLSCSRHGYRPCSLHMNRNVGTISVDQPVIIHETRTLPTVAITELAVSQLNLAISALLADPPSTNSGIIRLEQSFQRLSENVLKKIEAANWPSDDYISNSEDTSEIIWKAKLIKKPKKGIMEIIWRLKFEEFSHLHFFQMEILWPKTTRLRSSEVPIKEKAAAIDWLHAQHHLPCYYFSGRGQNREQDLIRISGNEHGGCHDKDEKCFVSVAGVGSAVSFRGSDPFSLEDWKCIKRFLSKDCPLVRAYGAIRFDAKRNISTEWKEFGSFYFIVPQVEFDEFEDGSMLATTIAWDDSLLLTWEEAVNGLLATMNQLSVRFDKLEKSIQRTAIVGCSHVPSKASWNDSVTKALETINRRHSDLVKVVLARCSRYVTDSVIDPLALLASLQVEGQNAYQFYIQPSNAPAFIGNTPEKLFHRKFLSISSEALAGTRARGVTKIQDFQNGQDLFYSRKDDMEFSIVRDSIRGKLETICNEVIVDPRKGLRKLPRVQHLCAELFGKLRRECDEFYALTSLHPSPAVCGMPSEEARKFIEEHEKFDRGMYAGPVGWFGGSESEFAVGIRSALVGQDLNTLVFAGAGIVEGTVPSLEWEEVDLKISQFTNALHSKHV